MFMILQGLFSSQSHQHCTHKYKGGIPVTLNFSSRAVQQQRKQQNGHETDHTLLVNFVAIHSQVH